MAPRPIERASAADLMELAIATTPAAGQVGAVLVFAGGRALDVDVVRSALADRICGVPRLRERLQSVPFGCGRRIWVDDASFDIANHVDELQCRLPGEPRPFTYIEGSFLPGSIRYNVGPSGTTSDADL